MAVVLVLGARPSEQTSSKSPSSITTLAARPTVLVRAAVIATSGTPNSRSDGNSCVDFGRFAALREHHDHVVGMNAAQIAVKRLGRMQKMGRRARRRKRGGNFLPDQPGLAHAGDDRAALAGVQQLDRLAERGIQTVRNLPNAGRLAAHDLSRRAKLFLCG